MRIWFIKWIKSKLKTRPILISKIMRKVMFYLSSTKKFSKFQRNHNRFTNTVFVSFPFFTGKIQLTRYVKNTQNQRKSSFYSRPWPKSQPSSPRPHPPRYPCPNPEFPPKTLTNIPRIKSFKININTNNIEKKHPNFNRWHLPLRKLNFFLERT